VGFLRKWKPSKPTVRLELKRRGKKMKNGFPSILTLLLLLLALIMMSKTTVSSPPPTIQVLVSTAEVNVGERFKVSINIMDVSDFSCLQYRLSWDPEVLRVEKIYEGEFMPGRGKSFFLYGVYEKRGYALISNALIGPAISFIESGNLSTIEFSAIKVGYSALNVSDTPYTHKGASVSVKTTETKGTATNLRNRSIIKQSSSVLTVGPGQQFSTIQDAINAASPGDKIHVFSGIYTEDVLINKHNLTLIGENKSATIIQASTYGIKVLDVNNTKIMGFTIQGGSQGGVVVYYYSNKTIIKDNIIRDNNVGVALHGYGTSLAAINETVVGNNITNNLGAGILVWNTEGDVIRANNITINYYGVQKSSVFANSIICFNNIVDNTYQLYPTTIDSTIQWYCTVDGNNKGNYWNPPDPDANDPYPLTDLWTPISGDVNLDGAVNMRDINIAAIAFGSKWSDYRWDTQADLDQDGKIDIKDIFGIARHYGQVDP
jgi:hypothetical protein